MNNSPPDEADTSTPEQFIGRQVRMLRQIRGWSQQEIAERMRAYGYQWSQATVTRLEAATRPIRLNELVDLAALFNIPVAQFLDFWTPEFGIDDLDALKNEIATLESERGTLEEQLTRARADETRASMLVAVLAADLARIVGRLRALTRWLPRLESGEAAGGGGEQ